MGCKDDACHRAESSDDQSLRDVGSEMVDTNPQLMQLEITNSRKRCLCVMIHVCPSHRAENREGSGLSTLQEGSFYLSTWRLTLKNWLAPTEGVQHHVRSKQSTLAASQNHYWLSQTLQPVTRDWNISSLEGTR